MTRKKDGKTLSYYDYEQTVIYASKYDQRFSYCLYIPKSYEEDASNTYPLAVVVHGTLRNTEPLRDAFIGFAEENQCIILSPLFPAGINLPGELNNYKYILYDGIRFDHVLLAMVDEVAEKYRLEKKKFLLYGFSGGGHFSHRFFYLHPDRLMGVSIGAPGVVTLLNPELDWWAGVRDIEQRFGRKLDYEEMQKVAVHMVVGSQDTETWEIAIHPGDSHWMPGAEKTGLLTRIDRVKLLKESFENVGIRVQLSIVPDASHEGYKMLDEVKKFFSSTIKDSRANVK